MFNYHIQYVVIFRFPHTLMRYSHTGNVVYTTVFGNKTSFIEGETAITVSAVGKS